MCPDFSDEVVRLCGVSRLRGVLIVQGVPIIQGAFRGVLNTGVVVNIGCNLCGACPTS